MENFPTHHPVVQNSTFPPTFPYFPTHLLTTTPPLSFIHFIHYSTTPTITTTNYLYNRKELKNHYENQSHPNQIK